jgi:UDP-glucose 4-epimerase
LHYLITGGAGFIGSHLAEKLLQEGHFVSIIDDLSTGSIRNVAQFRDHKRFQCVVDTILNKPALAELVDQADVVFHLAAAVGVRLIVESPVRTIETNIKGTELVLECANQKKKKVIIASTSEVYGKGEKVPYSEEDDLVLGSTLKGRWSYACSKAIDEFLALAYNKEKGLPVIIVRLFNTVGPRQTGQYGMVIPNFVKQALLGQPITVFGDGQQSRCFCHVHDVVSVLVRLSGMPEVVAQILNVGSDEEISMNELANLVKQLTGSASPIRHIPYEQAYEAGFEDMRRRVPEISRIRKLLNYEPAFGIQDILKDTIEYHRKILSEGG